MTILRFPPSPPELDWLKEVPETLRQAQKIGLLADETTITNLDYLYKYLRWSNAYNLTTYEPKYPYEHKVAHGMVLKYYRLMRGEEPMGGREIQDIQWSEQMLKESNEEIRRRKAAQSKG